MEALLTLLKDPATGNVAMWVIVALMLVHQSNLKRLFVRSDNQEIRLSRLEGEHAAARALGNCPMESLPETMNRCPLVKRTKAVSAAHNRRNSGNP